jgi:hypothetical protein
MNEKIVINAKEELKVIKSDLDNLETKRKDTNKEYEQFQNRTHKLKESISKKLNTQDQKEILRLLCSNFEFEMKNLETQAEVLIRDFHIREKEMVILRLEQHRSLCDMLIQQQRRLIIEQNLPIDKDLDELYYLYSRDISNGQLMKDITELNNNKHIKIPVKNIHQSNSNKSLIKISEEDSLFKEIGTITTEEKMYEVLFPSPWSKRNLLNTFDRSNSDNKVFYKVNKGPTNDQLAKNTKKEIKRETYKNKSSNFSNTTPMPHFAFNKLNKESKNNVSMLSTGTNDSNIEILIENYGYEKMKNMNSTPGLEQFDDGSTVKQTRIKKSMKKNTQGIAAVAAQKKASQHHRDLMQELIKKDETKNNKSESPYGNYEANSKDNVNGLNFLNMKVLEKPNGIKQNILVDGGNKTKKHVKIKENTDT